MPSRTAYMAEETGSKPAATRTIAPAAAHCHSALRQGRTKIPPIVAAEMAQTKAAVTGYKVPRFRPSPADAGAPQLPRNLPLKDMVLS